MLTACITAKYVNPPKAGKKMATIKDTTDCMWLVIANKRHDFTPGGTYDVEYEESDYRGITYRTIKTYKEVADSAPATAPRPSNFDTATAERIFVCGGLNSMLQAMGAESVALTEEHLVTLVNKLRKVWSRTFGGKPSLSDDMGGDEIPF